MAISRERGHCEERADSYHRGGGASQPTDGDVWGRNPLSEERQSGLSSASTVFEILRRHVQDWGDCDDVAGCACSHAQAVRFLAETPRERTSELREALTLADGALRSIPMQLVPSEAARRRRARAIDAAKAVLSGGEDRD